jgi:hypothetical protein
MSAAAYVEGGVGDDSPEPVSSPDFLKWKCAQIAVTRRPACFVLAILCLIPIPLYYCTGGSDAAFERFVGYGGFGASGSVCLCVTQAAVFLIIAYLSRLPYDFKCAIIHPIVMSSSVALSLLCIVVICPSCLLSLAAAPSSHGVAHSAILFAISCLLLDISFPAALPAAAATLVSNSCFLAYAPRDTAVYQNFM